MKPSTNVAAKFAPLLETRKRLLPVLAANAKARDGNGSATNLLARAHRFIGVAEYVVNGDVDTFRRELMVSAKCRLELLDRFERGDPLSTSFAAMTGGYHALFDALAAGDSELSCQLASRIGGREEIEENHDHPFDLTFAYALKAVVLQSSDLDQRLRAFRDVAAATENRDFGGYASALAVQTPDRIDVLASAFSSIIQGHKRQSKSGVFKGTVDEALCVWGVAAANLLTWKGLPVDVDDPILPRTLISPSSTIR